MSSNGKPPLRVGMVGYAFMGAAHSLAWRQAPRMFDLSMDVQMTAVAGRNPAAVRSAADRMGWRDVETDWRDLVARGDIDLIDICTPGNLHHEIGLAALAAGKHVLCEKPLANTVEQAQTMVAAADAAAARGQVAMVGFNYRRVPALTLAQQWIGAGRIGQVRHVRAVYLQDWLVDPAHPLVWRLRKEAAGSGALGDIGAHIVDLAQYLTGDRLVEVSALTTTFVSERPLPGPVAPGEPSTGQVTVDDAALFLGRFAGGAVGTFEATRFATGRKNGLRIEINGSAGSLSFDLEALNELHFYDGTQPPNEQGFRRVLVTEPEHPYLSAWWPAGHGLGYEHSFVHEIVDLVETIGTHSSASPSFADGLQVQQVLAAVERSAAGRGGWEEIPRVAGSSGAPVNGHASVMVKEGFSL